MRILLLAVVLAALDASPVEDSARFCEAYAECASVALLEERLCLGNSHKRPYWLPDSHDPHRCHDKLKNDYRMVLFPGLLLNQHPDNDRTRKSLLEKGHARHVELDRMEEEYDSQFTACLVESANPLAMGQAPCRRRKRKSNPTCNARILRNVKKFSFGRTITFIPNNCFTGLENRRERECGTVKQCCASVGKCTQQMEQSSLQRILEEKRVKMRQRAKDCEKGITIEELPAPPLDYLNNEDASWSPSGHVNVNFRQNGIQENEGNKQNRQGAESGFVNVNFATVDEQKQEEKAKQLLYRKGDRVQSEGAQGTFDPAGEEPQLNVAQPDEGNRKLETILRIENEGSLTIGEERPKLSWPNKLPKEVQKTRVITSENSEIRRKPTLPMDLESHNKAFEKALEKTNQYKEVIDTLSSPTEIAKEGVDSLLNAADVSEALNRQTQVAPAQIGVASGTMNKMPIFEDEDFEEGLVRGGIVVTSSPIILIKEADKEKQRRQDQELIQSKLSKPASGCVDVGGSAKTARLETILTLLGEEQDSKDIAELKSLIHSWHDEFEKKLLSVKEKNKKQKVESLLNRLMSHFDMDKVDEVSRELNSSLTAVVNCQSYGTISESSFSQDDNSTSVNKDAANGLLQLEQPAITEVTDNNNSTMEIAELIDDNGDTILVSGDVDQVLIANPKGSGESSVDHAEDVVSWDNEEYKQAVSDFVKRRGNATEPNMLNRNETTCDSYMRCRSQMHLAVDGCAWKFSSEKVMGSMAESAESLLFKGEITACDPPMKELYGELYEMVIEKNVKQRKCLDDKNEEFFSESICIPYEHSEEEKYKRALVRIVESNYTEALECYMDANRIQEKCTKLRECCPNFDNCREETIDVNLEQGILSLTARINESKQECIKNKARKAFKDTVRSLLGKNSEQIMKMLKKGSIGLDITRGAQLMKRLK